MHLYEVKVKCLYSEEYKQKWNRKDSESTHLSFDPTQDYNYVGPNYEYVTGEFVQLSDEDYNERRIKASERHPNICCELAIIDPYCVCSWKSLCPVHGSACHGTHD